jgi:anaerobic selenocysteine-containing dehydrogenase
VLRAAVEMVVGDPTARLQDRDPDRSSRRSTVGAVPTGSSTCCCALGPTATGSGRTPTGSRWTCSRPTRTAIDLGPLTPRLPDAIRTASGKVELAAPELLTALGALEDELDAPVDELVLIGRRHLRTNNSWSHNVAGLAKGQQLCTLQVHPDDASRCGVHDGGSARVRSRAGEVEVTVEVTDDLRPGVVSLPHGFGHDLEGVELTVARQQPGVNTNVLTDREDVDPLSGTAVLNGIPVEVGPA